MYVQRRQWLAVLAILLAAPLTALGDDAQQVWLVTSRCAPRSGDLEAGFGQLGYWQLDAANPTNWLPADAAAFHAADTPAVPTVVFVHGNRVDRDDAIADAWPVYCRLKAEADGRAFRMVIWSWPSDRLQGRRLDAQVKDCYSNTEAYYLGRLLGGMAPASRVSLIGYSFGAKIIAGALELLAGGQVLGRSLPVPSEKSSGAPLEIRAVLIAAALEAGALSTGHRDGKALGVVQRVLVTQNPCDSVLRWYPRLYGRRGPQAMGYAGPCCWSANGDCQKLEVVDVGSSVGRSHDWCRYQAAPAFVQRLGWYSFLDAVSTRPVL